MFRPAMMLAAILIGVFTSLAIVIVIALIGRDPIPLDYLEDAEYSAFELQRWRYRSPEAWHEFTPWVLDYHWAGGRFVSIFGVKNEVQTDDYSSPEYASQLARREGYTIDIEQEGWPFFCAYKEKWSQTQGRNQVDSGENILVIGTHRFPRRILWTGLIGNTLIYGSFAWIIMMSIVLARQWYRLRSGRCPNCAYRLQDRIAEGCPECGWNRPAASHAESEPGATDSEVPM